MSATDKQRATQNESSRILWIGDNEHPEFHEAWQWCHHTKHCNHRDTVEDAAERPLKRISRIVVARASRSVIPQTIHERLLCLYPIASWATLLGSLCEGEARTGTPWPQCQRIYWHQWNSKLRRWCDEVPTAPALENGPAGLTAVITHDLSLGTAIVEALADKNVNAFVTTPSQIQTAGQVNDVLWDDTVLRKASDWPVLKDQLRESQAQGMRHHWLATTPRYDQWKILQDASFSSLHSKPLDITAVAECLS